GGLPGRARVSGNGQQIKAGLIGYGYWGPNLARNLGENTAFELCAIAEPRTERRELAARRHPGAQLFADSNGLLGRDDLQAIVIATPLTMHHELARTAIDRGKHVLVEKPLAASPDEADDPAKPADARGVSLVLDHPCGY